MDSGVKNVELDENMSKRGKVPHIIGSGVKNVELDEKWLPTSQAGLGMVEVHIQFPKFVT